MATKKKNNYVTLDKVKWYQWILMTFIITIGAIGMFFAWYFAR